ncbi:MAG: hypothetical protein M1818_007818 [Claussenomyces sp. TS43310]|nr:MAG: hypothetical protein M1818_007818 [Claussenomyces sp. TS43310]
MASKPVFIFIPGAWHSAQAFAAAAALLKAKGYESVSVELASYGSLPPQPSIEADVALVRGAVGALLDAGKDVVVVMHSYGSVPACEAMKHFTKTNDGSEGRGRIVRMVWLAAFILPKGGSLMAGLGGKDLPWFIVKDDQVDPRDPATIFYNDMPPSEAARWIAQLKTHSYRTFYSTLSVEPFLHIPSAYLICERDNAIPLAVQEGMIAMAQEKVPTAFDVVERCGASHSPFLSMPETVASFLEKAATGAREN